MKINCFCSGEREDCLLHKLVKASAVYFLFIPTEYSRLLQTLVTTYKNRWCHNA